MNTTFEKPNVADEAVQSHFKHWNEKQALRAFTGGLNNTIATIIKAGNNETLKSAIGEAIHEELFIKKDQNFPVEASTKPPNIEQISCHFCGKKRP